MIKSNPTVELKLPIIENMELVATQTAEVVSKHMQLDNEKTSEISMALIEACINAFEHSKTKKEVFIHFIISDESLTIKVIDKGKGFDSSKISIPNIDNKLGSNEKKRGWGVMLIKELMDYVDYESSEQGTILTMTKNKNSNE
jgi:serine/threonine-protein kinase RsbW